MIDEQESFVLKEMIKFAKEDGCSDLVRTLKSLYDS